MVINDDKWLLMVINGYEMLFMMMTMMIMMVVMMMVMMMNQ